MSVFESFGTKKQGLITLIKTQGTTVKMEIIEKKGFAVIGLKVQAKWDDLHKEMSKAWQKFEKRLEKIPDRKNDMMMDISLEASDGMYTQLIGVEVEKDATVPEGMAMVIIPSQKYVRHRHQGVVSDIADAFGKIYDWSQQQDINVSDFKLDIGYQKDGSETTHDLYVKVV